MSFEIDYLRKTIAFQRKFRNARARSVGAIDDYGPVAWYGQLVGAGKGQPEGHVQGTRNVPPVEFGSRSNIDDYGRISLCNPCGEFLASNVCILRADGPAGGCKNECCRCQKQECKPIVHRHVGASIRRFGSTAKP